MGVHDRTPGTEQHAVRQQCAPFIEEARARGLYSRDPGAVAPDWQAYFDEPRGGRRRRGPRPGDRTRSSRLAKSRTPRRRDGRCSTAMHKQVLVLRLDQQVPHPRHVQRRPRPASSARTSATSPISSIIKTYQLHRRRPHGHRVRRRLASRPAPAALRACDLRDIIKAALPETYVASTFGVEYMYISDMPFSRFLQQRIEPIRTRVELYA